MKKKVLENIKCKDDRQRITSKKEFARLIENINVVIKAVLTANVIEINQLIYSLMIVITRELGTDIKKKAIKDLR